MLEVRKPFEDVSLGEEESSSSLWPNGGGLVLAPNTCLGEQGALPSWLILKFILSDVII